MPAAGHASAIGEYGGVLAFPPPADSWPGVLESIGSPALPSPEQTITGVLFKQYQLLTQEMRSAGLSAAVFTELANYEQELGLLTYDRRAYTTPPGFVHHLNRQLILASERMARPAPAEAGGPAGDDRAVALRRGRRGDRRRLERPRPDAHALRAARRSPAVCTARRCGSPGPARPPRPPAR